MTFVRVSGQAGNPEEAVDNVTAVDNAVPEDPILMLDQDQITKLENVLRSEEAKDFLGEVLSNPGSNPNESLGDFLTPAPETVGPPPPLIPNDEVIRDTFAVFGINELGEACLEERGFPHSIYPFSSNPFSCLLSRKIK